MSNYNSFIIPSTFNKNDQQQNCLEQYYRYIVGMSMNQQQLLIQQQQQNTKSSIVNAIINNQNDLNHYQKIYVDTLVDITTLTIRTSWPMEISTTKEGQPVVNTHAFVRHLLKRSRATRSTLQLAIFYLFRIRPHITQRSQIDAIVKCGRRMFLAALICAHKYLYDNTFTNASWAKISKLPVKEINQAERALLEMLDYRLFVSTELYSKFEAQLKEAIPASSVGGACVATKKRSFEDNEQQQQQQHTLPRPMKKSRQDLQAHHLVHGIPTPEDDKVEL